MQDARIKAFLFTIVDFGFGNCFTQSLQNSQSLFSLLSESFRVVFCLEVNYKFKDIITNYKIILLRVITLWSPLSKTFSEVSGYRYFDDCLSGRYRFYQ